MEPEKRPAGRNPRAGSKRPAGFTTRAIHAGERADPATRAHATPIYQTATFSFDTAEEKAAAMESALAWKGGYFYSRTGNPTTAALEAKLADLEGAEDAVVGASGMSALATALFATLNAGDHLVTSDDVFVISRSLLQEDLPRRGIEVSPVPITDFDAVRAAIRPTTRAIYTETYSNPYMRIADVPALAAIAREGGLRLIVDNTFLGPSLYRPLEDGADLVIHSATKYLAGHGDALAGVVAGPKALIDRVRYQLDVLGSCISPFNAWLVLRGVRTLPLRMEAHCRNGAALAAFLEGHPAVSEVWYSGLASHPDHAVAARLLGDRFGGMMSIRLHGGRERMNAFANALELCELAVSLGDVFTLVYPMPKRDNLIRLSVGCEDIDDIVGDFAQALDSLPT
jgi:cystathionine beta-lyase/cystathionine gamma-synthase